MYYDDDKSYQYNYRKGDGNLVEPVYTRNYAEEPVQTHEPPKKRHGVAIKTIALMLCCALIGGLIGAGAINVVGASLRGKTNIKVSTREVAEVVPVKVDGKRQLTMPEIYASTINSVVAINTTVNTTNVYGQTVQNAAAGSGFIITDDGYILTNYHVIEDASDVKVTLYNGDVLDGEIIGGDKDYDIAVVKINAKDLSPVTLGDSTKLNIGETVAAIGNPLGELTFSMSQGIISCVDRIINVDGTPFNMIQVDCSINHGNSGGPLVNSYGEVVGIVSAKYESYATSPVEGLGFAIPINDVIAMVEDIITNGYVTNKPFIGITPQNLTARMAQQYRYSISQGVFVCSVEPGSAAEKAGLRMGDVITKIDDKEIAQISDLTAAKKGYSAGDTVTLTVYRGGETLTMELTFDATPEKVETQENTQPQQQMPSEGYNYYNPWDFFNSFFGNGYFDGSGYSDGYNGSYDGSLGGDNAA